MNNRLLEVLPSRDRQRLLSVCSSVELVAGDVLYTPTVRMTHAYFITSGYVSLMMTIDGASRLAVGLTGDEGMCGSSLTLGADSSRVMAVVQGMGTAMCLDSAALAREILRSKPLARVLRLYVLIQMQQLAQLVACTRFHIVEARLARWLLLTRDRAHSDTLLLTQEFLAVALGVRRVGITSAAGELQRRGLISYSRGTITVLDTAGLKVASCACYAAERASYARVFSDF